MKPVITILAFIVLLAAGSHAQSMSTLQNLPSVAVTVRTITPDGQSFGLKEDALVKAVTDTLVAAGVKVATPAEADDAPEMPIVEITALVTKHTATGHIYALRLALTEIVVLRRKTKSLIDLPAVTWEKEMQGYTARPDRIVAGATALAERFAAEWKEAN